MNYITYFFTILRLIYKPFNNIEEIIEASLEHNKNHYLSKVGGLWLKSKEDGIICLITSRVSRVYIKNDEVVKTENEYLDLSHHIR